MPDATGGERPVLEGRLGTIPCLDSNMPILSKFYGIVIRMAFDQAAGARIHASYGSSEIVVGLNPLRILQGDAPERVRALVLEWASAHYVELLDAWKRCAAAEPATPIAPLP